MNIDKIIKYMDQFSPSYTYYYDDVYRRTGCTLKTHEVIFELIDNYLNNILDSPSTINKIITHISLDVDPNNSKYICIMFDGKIIRRYLVVGGLNCHD